MGEARGRVALLAHPGGELYGSDRMLLETVRGLTDAGWRVVLAVPGDGPLLPAARAAGAEVVVLVTPVLRKRMLTPGAWLPSAVAALSGTHRILRLLGTLRPDVVYVSTLTLPLWIACARARRVPVICHVHESERRAHALLRTALARPLQLARIVVANSAFSRDSLTDVVPRLRASSVVIYNGVVGPADPTPPRSRLDGPLRVVYVGRLSPRKGPDLAIQAVELLTRDGFDVTLDLVGSTFDGYEWYERRLHDQVVAAGLTGRVRFRGFLPTVWQSLEGADVAVVTSREEEPFGNTAIEAILAARPVVVSAIGGLAEAIDGFASALPVPADDAAALADALRRIRSEWPALRSAAIELAPTATRRYAPSRYRAEIVAVLEEAVRFPVRELVTA